MILINRYLPVFQFSERHHLLVNTQAKALLDAAIVHDTTGDPWVQAFIKLRELPGRLLGVSGYGSKLNNRAIFGLNDFTFLGRDSDREIVFGLAGKFWQFGYGLVNIDTPEKFESFNATGVPKLVLNFTVESLDNGRTRLVTETRVFCNDRKSLMQFFPYWWIIRPVSGLIRRRILMRIANAATACAN